MARLGDVIEQIRGVSYKPSDLKDTLNDNSVILLRANNIQDGKIVLDDVLYVSKSKVNASQYLRRGDILVCTSSGSKELVGKAASVDEDLPAVFGAFCKVVRPKIECCKYVGHFFQSPYYRNYISAASAGANINNLRNEHIADLHIPLPPLDKQRQIAAVLDKVSDLMAKRHRQLNKLDELIKSRFMEMFGDPIDNTMGLRSMPLGEACYLKAGITTSADAIHDQSAEYPVPCYGGNGIRGYVEKATQSGCYPIVGRQGALCGNVQLVTGEFHATEHAVLVTPIIEANVVWLFHLLKLMDLYRFHTGAAQPGLAVKTLNTVTIPITDIHAQEQFAAFVAQTDKSKSTIQKSLEKLEILKKSLMQKYFG